MARAYFIFFRSESTFLNPAGTANSEASAEFEEKVPNSVVISRREPGAPEGWPPPEAFPFAGAAAGWSGAGFFLPSPNLLPSAPPIAPPTDVGGADCCC